MVCNCLRFRRPGDVGENKLFRLNLALFCVIYHANRAFIMWVAVASDNLITAYFINCYFFFFIIILIIIFIQLFNYFFHSCLDIDTVLRQNLPLTARGFTLVVRI